MSERALCSLAFAQDPELTRGSASTAECFNARDRDKECMFKDNTQLEVPEVSLEESLNAMLNLFSVSTDYSDKNFTVVEVARIMCRATNISPAVEGENCWAFERLVEAQFHLDDGLDKGSLLHLATSREQEALVRAALDCGAEIDGKTKNGATPLHLAVTRGALPLVKLLIEEGANINIKDAVDRTPLHYACHSGSFQIVQLLLKHNADIHAKANKGSTPLHEAASVNREDTAAIVRLILKAGAAVDVKDTDGRSPLDFTCVPSIQEILLQNGADANSVGSHHPAPILKAAETGNIASIKLLLQYGAWVNRSFHSRTPLHHACRKGCFHMVRLLLKNNANIHATTNENSTPLHEAVSSDSEDTAAIVRLLLEAGATVSVVDRFGRTPLHWTRVPEIEETLLKNGADPNSLDSYGRAPIHKAAEWGNVASIEILLYYGAQMNMNADDKSVLELVYDRWVNLDPNVFKLLLEFGFIGSQVRYEVFSHQVFKKIVSRMVRGIACTLESFLCRQEYIIKCSRILSHHVVKMTVLYDLPSDWTDVLLIWPWESGTVDEFRLECVEEVDEMKATLLGDTDLSLYDLLVRDEYKVARLLWNQVVAKAVDPNTLQNRFPLYGAILAHHVKKGRHRKWLQVEGVRSLNLLCPWFKRFPDEIKEEILGHLAIVDIVNLVRTSF